jgi:hypothetical protein
MKLQFIEWLHDNCLFLHVVHKISTPEDVTFIHLHSLSLKLLFCATNRKVAGSVPDGVIGISH